MNRKQHNALELYNQSGYKKAPFMRVRIEDGVDKTADAFAVEILRALQFWQGCPKIVMQLCTGESPFIGYRKIGGDRFLRAKGLYDPGEFAGVLRKYGRAGAILDTWHKPLTQAFLKHNGLDPRIRPDMNKVIIFAIDAIFPRSRSDYFAFANLLNNVCDLWGISVRNRNFFYGDIYVVKQAAFWRVERIPDEEYGKILESVDTRGLKILEYQAACLLKGKALGFALNSSLRIKGNKIFGTRLRRKDNRDFQPRETQLQPLKPGHIQYRYLEGMRNQALMMHQKLAGFGGAHITLLGVGACYEGRGHIGFCEQATPAKQACFIGAVNDYDSTFHISGAHAKEFYGFKNMFVTFAQLRMPRFGFITYGPAELFYRRKRQKPGSGKRDISKEVIVIVITTGNLKSRSVAKAIEGRHDCQYPLSLTQNCRGVYVLDKTAASQLRIGRYPWEFQQRRVKQKPAREILSGIIRPGQITQKLKQWDIAKKDSILFINPHMDDDFLAMMHLLKEMSPYFNIHTCYTSLGYTAVYSDYILGLLKAANGLTKSETVNLNPRAKQKLLKQLIEQGRICGRIPDLDYEVLPYMGRKETALRARLLLIDLNQTRLFKNRFSSSRDILQLREFLAEVERRKPRGGAPDLEIMRFLKTSVRFTEAVSSLMFLGVPYKNIYWPLELSFYGTFGRPLAIKQEDINKIKGIVSAVSPKMVVFNGEGFPDFGSHSNTEIGTYAALFELLKQAGVNPNLVLFQWAGVWDRIGLNDSEINVVLTREELQDFCAAFNYFYPTQAPYAPMLNASSAYPQPFTRDVILNARKSAGELLGLADLPADTKALLKHEGGLLSYKVARLKDARIKRVFLKKQQELIRSGLSINISGNTALIGPPAYPKRLNELPASVISKMLSASAISTREKKLFGCADTFHLSSEGMLEIIYAFHKEMRQGLIGKNSSLAMLPTFARGPTGKEKGIFLALDLGGSTFRVLMVYLAGNSSKPKAVVEKYTLKATGAQRKKGIDYDYTQGSAKELFAAIARYIKMFLTKHHRRVKGFGYKKPFPLGFTFSFPLNQTAIDRAILKKASKGFRMSGLANKDVVRFLRKAISDEQLDDLVDVVSLDNDTVGTLVTGRYRDKDCDIGGIIGTGTNFCSVEMVKNIHTLTSRQKAEYSSKAMIINIESGNFDKIARNAYDKLLDQNSTRPGDQITEKMVSGLYLGELTRLALMDLINKGLLFHGQLTKKEMAKLSLKGSFPSPFMTKIAQDRSCLLKDVHAQLIQWGVNSRHISLEDKRQVKQVCLVVARRAARVTAAVVFAIVTHIDKQIKRRHTIAIDGSLFEKYPAFKQDMIEAIKEISLEIFKQDRSDKIFFKLTRDGSGIGAAIIAAMQLRGVPVGVRHA